MRNYLTYLLIVLVFISGVTEAKKWSKRKVAGQYIFSAAPLFDGTLVLTKDKIASKLPSTTNAHSVAGKWKFKRGKQLVTILWPDEATFEGYVVDLDNITGQYNNVEGESTVCTFNRVTNEFNMFHMHITRTWNRRAKGNVLFNYGKYVKRKYYKVAVYSRMSGEVAQISYTAEHKTRSKLTHFGFFKRNLKPYDYVECYLISKEFDPPLELTNFPALSIDGTNVFAFDWQEPGFKWFDWSVTNYY